MQQGQVVEFVLFVHPFIQVLECVLCAIQVGLSYRCCAVVALADVPSTCEASEAKVLGVVRVLPNLHASGCLHATSQSMWAFVLVPMSEGSAVSPRNEPDILRWQLCTDGLD